MPDSDSTFVDLHTHSTASDGSLTPQDVVRSAHELGLAAVALTDHDSVEGPDAETLSRAHAAAPDPTLDPARIYRELELP